MAGNGYAAGPIGASRGATVLGDAVSGYSKSKYYGWDFTLISAIIGRSNVTSAEPIECGCK